MLLRSDDQRINRGAKPQRRLMYAASASPGLAQLFREHEQHLAAVLIAKGRRVAMKQRLVDPFCAHTPSRFKRRIPSRWRGLPAAVRPAAPLLRLPLVFRTA